ncbi:MAG: hypothetical protein OK457_08340, partial [Thaumarchaeota archaeon]|nr:hypothetical protein [Nitrososphaerota archaeon]
MKYRQAIWKEPLLKEKSRKGRRGYSVPPLESRIKESIPSPYDAIPQSMIRQKPPELPELSEPEILRHFV